MIIHLFLRWVRTAPPSERAEATAALARAYLFSGLSEEDSAMAEGALTMLLDDTSALVRRALAQALARSADAPAAVVHGLACDQPDIASIVLAHSPLFVDDDLVEIVATGEPALQEAIAGRARVTPPVAAALAEVGTAEACLTLAENPGAEFAEFSLHRVIERFGALAAVREALLARGDVTAAMRLALVAKLSDTLLDLVVTRGWMQPERARRMARDAGERATVAIASDAPHEAAPLVRHLRDAGQLTFGLILRALLSGNIGLFEQALSDLSGVAVERVHGLMQARGASFRAIYDRAGLPASAFPAVREAVAAAQDVGASEDLAGSPRLRRHIVGRVLARCERSELEAAVPLLMMLRRFATEAAREEARTRARALMAGPHSARVAA